MRRISAAPHSADMAPPKLGGDKCSEAASVSTLRVRRLAAHAAVAAEVS